MLTFAARATEFLPPATEKTVVPVHIFFYGKPKHPHYNETNFLPPRRPSPALVLTLGGCAKDSTGPETSDLIPASTGDRWGFIDRTGK